MIGKPTNPQPKVENILVLTVLSGSILAGLLWVCVVVANIERDLEETHNTLNAIHETLEKNSVLIEILEKTNVQIEEKVKKL